jgi:hypothetical protein
LDGELPEPAFPDCSGEGRRRGAEARLVVGEGQQGAAAAFDVQNRQAIDEDREGAGFPCRAVFSVADRVGPW